MPVRPSPETPFHTSGRPRRKSLGEPLSLLSSLSSLFPFQSSWASSYSSSCYSPSSYSPSSCSAFFQPPPLSLFFSSSSPLLLFLLFLLFLGGFHFQAGDVNTYLELVKRLLGSEGIEETDDVFVVDEFHEFELAISSLCVRHILKGTRKFFDGAVLTGDGVVGRAHDALTPKGRGAEREKKE